MKKFLKGGVRFYYGDNLPVGDVDIRHFFSGGPCLFLYEIKWSYEEILKHQEQKWNFQEIVSFLHPFVWVVYIIGKPIGPDNTLQCERFFRVMKGGRLQELEFYHFSLFPGNLGTLIAYCRKACLKEIEEHYKNDNKRFFPDYGKKKVS